MWDREDAALNPVEPQISQMARIQTCDTPLAAIGR